MTGFDRSRLKELPPEYTRVITDFEEFKDETGKDGGSIETYLNRVTDFFEWLTGYADAPALDNVDRSHATRYDKWAKATYSGPTHRHRIVTLHNMYEVLDDLEVRIWLRPFEGLPDSQEVRDNQKHGRGFDVSEISRFILSVKNPLWHAFFLLLIKTLCRNQEATNIYLKEVHINDPEIDQLYSDLDITHHAKIAYHTDSIYIPADRKGNKRKSDTRIPIDQELKAALIRWLTVRPTTTKSISGQQPLFVSLGDNWGEPLSPSSVSLKFASLAPEDWRPDEDPFSPHDFRHWTTRQLRGDIQDHCLNYLRGDAPNILDHYDDLLADYEERIRDPYLQHIPSMYY